MDLEVSSEDKLQGMPTKQLEDGVYYTPVFINHRTGNRGFISGYEFFTPMKSHVRFIVAEYEARLKSNWSLAYSGQYLRVNMPKDKGKYPLVPIEEGGTILPFAAISGPLYNEIVKTVLIKETA